MAKTKTGRSRSLSRPRNSTSRRNSNPEDGQGNIENGLYVHSSPPKVVSSSQGGSGSAHIREYLRGGNIAGLEEVVLEGQGPKLLTQSSTDPKVRAFLKTLPSFMSKIDLVHDAAERGDLRDLKTLLDRRKIARSRDSQGMGLMHKAVLSGNTEMVDYLMDNFPETAATIDNEGRTPLHYSAASKSPDAVFNALSNAPGVDAQARDSRGKTASHYMSRPADLKVAHKQKHSGGSRKKSTPSKRLQKVSTPPKREGLNITGANIRIWIHDQDLPKLERIVWEGQGQKLMKETSNIPKVRQFLNLVPRMMIKIKEVHQGVVTGDMEMLETKADQPELLAAKDQNGLNALHKAAALGHVEMCDWIIQRNQSAVFTSDRMGRTPLHYAAIPDDGGETFDTLLRGGADKKHLDRFNKTAEMYRNKPGDLDLSVVYEPIAAPRSGNGTLDIPYSRGPSKTPSRAQSRAASRARPSRSLNVSRRSSAVAVTPRRAKSSERPRKGKTKSAEGDHGDLKDLEFRDMSGVTTEELDEMIRDGDLDTLQMVLLSGKGSELRGKSAWNAEVRQFLKRVPGFMEKVSSLHSAAASGNLKTVRQLTDRDRRLVLARAEDGSVALHHIARSGSVAGVKMIHAMYPDGVDIQDAEGKVPLHYAALSRSPGAREAFEYLEKVGGHADTEDNNGVIPSDYLNGEDEKPKRKPARAKSSMDLPPFGRRLQSRFSVPRSRGASRQPSPEPTPQNSRRNSRSRSKPNSRRNSRATSKNNSPAVSRRNSNVNSKNNSPANSRRGSRANSVGHSTAVSMKNSPTNSAENSPSHSKNNSPSNSREQTPNRARPHGVSDEEADAEVEEEVQSQLKRAESGDFDGLTDLILRGDGHLLVGRGSQDEETQSFLDRVPAILESAEEIHAAAEAGETRKVRGLIDRRKKASLRDSNQSNVLHKAVLHGHSDLVRYLVQSYPELLDQQDRAGRTPLHYAAVLRDGGHTFKTLNKAGADDSVVDRDGLSPADYLGSPDSITEKELKAELKDGIPLSSDAAPKHHENDRPTTAGSSGTRDDDGNAEAPQPSESPTNEEEGNDDDPDAQYPNMWTDEGEYLAKALGDALTKSLAEVNATRPPDPVSYLALMLYTQLLDPAVPQRAKREASRENSAHSSGQSTRSNSTIPMQTVFNSDDNNNSGSSNRSIGNKNGGRKRHVRDRNGRNALHLAAEKSHGPSVFLQLVRAAGVRLVAERDASYKTPRDLAALSQLQDNVKEIDSFVCSLAADGNVEDLRYLMLQGYDNLLTAEDEDGLNIVQVTEKHRQKKAYEQLQDASFYEERREWLNRAIMVGSLPHVQYIVDSPDLIIGRDTRGRLPLHLATLLEKADIVSYLVNKAPVTLAVGDNLGRTPLHYAMAVKKVEDVAPILVQAGAKRNIKDLRGKMPSYYYMKRDDMMQMLQEVYDEQEA